MDDTRLAGILTTFLIGESQDKLGREPSACLHDGSSFLSVDPPDAPVSETGTTSLSRRATLHVCACIQQRAPPHQRYLGKVCLSAGTLHSGTNQAAQALGAGRLGPLLLRSAPSLVAGGIESVSFQTLFGGVMGRTRAGWANGVCCMQPFGRGSGARDGMGRRGSDARRL